MPKLVVIDREGGEKAVEGEGGSTVMQIIRAAGFDELVALCGGSCSCATCHVYVDPAFMDVLPAIGEEEDELLDGSDSRQPTSRLSCQIKFNAALEGLVVRIAPED
jgi:2Fe-2S ferredoxin